MEFTPAVLQINFSLRHVSNILIFLETKGFSNLRFLCGSVAIGCVNATKLRNGVLLIIIGYH